MLADRALKVASDIQSDYQKLNIIHFLSLAVSASQSRGSANYAQLTKQVIDGLNETIKNSVFNDYPPDLYDWLEHQEFSQLLPKKVAGRVIAGFTGEPANHINANEISTIVQAANVLLAHCAGYIAFSKSLGIQWGRIADGAVSIDLSIPEEVFGGSFSGLIESYRHFDRLFQVSAELSGTSRVSLKFYKTSSSVITAVLIAAQEHYAAIIAVYGGIVGSAQKTIQLYKTIADLRASKVPASVVQQVEATRDTVRDAYLDELINDIMNKLGGNIEESRRNELRNELKISARLTMDSVINGARVSLSIENFNGSNLKKLNAEDGKTVLQEVQQIRQLENSIEQVKNMNPEMIKAITSQNIDK